MAEPAKKAGASKKASPAKKAAAKKAPSSSAKAASPTKKAPAKAKTPAKKAQANTAGPDSAVKSKHFKSARSKAQQYLNDPSRLDELVHDADKKSKKAPKLKRVLGDLKALLRLLTAYRKKQYREVSVEHLVLIVAALIYFVSPIDLIPDAIPGAGLVDDAAVLGFVITIVREEIDSFLAWEAAGSGAIPL